MKNFKKLYPVQILALFFIVVIIIGSFLLTMPISSSSGVMTNYLDALFTATSATSVTGLVTLDTGTYWSPFGTTVILMLIQIGGLGIMSFTTFGVLKYGNKISLYTSLLMKEALNVDEFQGMSRMIRYVIIFVVAVELLGMIFKFCICT